MKKPIGYILSEEDLIWIRENLSQIKNIVSNHRSRPPQEHSYAEAQDYQAPEVYIVKPQDLSATGTGTAADEPTVSIPGIVDGGTYHYISNAKCNVYKIAKNGALYELHPKCGLAGKDNCFHRVFNIGTDAISDSYLLAVKEKYGNYITIPSGSTPLVKCMLAEDHPGRHTPNNDSKEFKVWPGTWCPYDRAWRFDCLNESDSAKWDCEDSFYGGSTFEYPDKYAQCWCTIKSAPGCVGDIIYDVITGDCSSDGDPARWALPCETTTGTGS